MIIDVLPVYSRCIEEHLMKLFQRNYPCFYPQGRPLPRNYPALNALRSPYVLASPDVLNCDHLYRLAREPRLHVYAPLNPQKSTKELWYCGLIMLVRGCLSLFPCVVVSIGLLTAASDLSNRRAPGFALPDASLQYHDLYKYRGKIVILNVMQTTCPHCKSFSKNLKRLKDKYGTRVQIVNIVNPPDNLEKVRDYQRLNRTNQLILFDCGQVTASYLKITPENPRFETPYFFVIDNQGWIRDDYGYNALNEGIFTGEGLDKIIDNLLLE